MAGNDGLELALGAIAGLLVVFVGYGATLGDTGATTLSLAVVALVVTVAVVAVRRRRGGETGG